MPKNTTVKVDLGTPKNHTRSDREISFLVEKYLERHPEELDRAGMLDPGRVVDWAIEHGLYQPKPVDPRTQLRRRVSRHLGHRYMVDPQGRTVRALLAVPYVDDDDPAAAQKYGYFPLFQTEPAKVDLGLKMRLGWAYKRTEQIDIDWQSYNDNNVFGVKLKQLDFNFEQRMIDGKMPTEWPDEPPDDIDEDDDR